MRAPLEQRSSDPILQSANAPAESGLGDVTSIRGPRSGRPRNRRQVAARASTRPPRRGLRAVVAVIGLLLLYPVLTGVMRSLAEAAVPPPTTPAVVQTTPVPAAPVVPEVVAPAP